MKMPPRLSVTLLSTGVPRFAQDAGRIGEAMGHSSTVGATWHPTDRAGVVYTIPFSNKATESNFETQFVIDGVPVSSSTLRSSSEGWAMSPAPGAILYF